MNDNKLIAEFMGMEHCYRPYGDGFIELSATELCDVDDLRYHISWDWLMPVVIECFNRFSNTDTIDHMRLNDALLTCNINELHEAVVDFIKQHNDE